MENNDFLKIYFAGDLFDAKDLGGNLMLAEAIEEVSNGRYKVSLPQDGECEVKERTAQSIRDQDFRMLLESDVLVANFDGTDLDSGTVVEFCFAKMMDIPTVLLRTDFRDSGDSTLPDTTPWNLMASHFPRTSILHLNAMVLYHECRKIENVPERLSLYYRSIAGEVVTELDKVTSQRGWLEKDKLYSVLCNTVKSIGGGDRAIFSEEEMLDIVRRKNSSGLY